MSAIEWTDKTNYQGAPLYRTANTWEITDGTKTYKVEQCGGAYHVWDGFEWVGMYATKEDVETAVQPIDSGAEEATAAGDADIVKAFEAKAICVAKDNGWTITKAQTVMLAYLRDTSPAEAATIAEALQRHLRRAA